MEPKRLASLQLQPSQFPYANEKTVVPVLQRQAPRTVFSTEPHDVICFSHLRWNFVFQRPQHLMTRFAKTQRVFFVEEPIHEEGIEPRMEYTSGAKGVTVAVPHVPARLSEGELVSVQKKLLQEMLREWHIEQRVFWYYTPMALSFSEHLSAASVVYDCMDELSGFHGAHPKLCEWESKLFRRANVVLTGGRSLFEAKRSLHANIHAFPSSVDVAHFHKARQPLPEPLDQKDIPHRRAGFFGVIDERFDVELVARTSARMPDWHFVFLGPIVKIDPAHLPRGKNIHYLGQKTYEELPSYLASWDVALLPFARNDATRFISPTKTPEYLAAGRPVVSTSIRDVVEPYGSMGLVQIADDPESFCNAIRNVWEESLTPGWSHKVDAFLQGMSWDRTWSQINKLVIDSIPKFQRVAVPNGTV